MIVPVVIWYGRDWGYKGVKMEEALTLLIIGMLIWWKQQLTQGFSKFLQRI